MTITTVTHLEASLLDLILHSEHSPARGSTPTTLDNIGSMRFFPNIMAHKMRITEQALGGVTASLQQKGMLKVHLASKRDIRNGKYSSCEVTETGFAAWKVAVISC